MASRHVLDGFWDRRNVNGVNNNFVFLFDQISALLTNVNSIGSDLNTKAQTYENNFKYLFESAEKTLKISSDAKQAIQQAQEANAENKSVQKQIDQLIIDNGQSDAEVTQARVDINGVASDTLKARIDKVQKNAIDASQKSELYNKLYGSLSNLTLPNALNMAVPFNVKTALNGDVDINYDVSVNKNKVLKRYYIDVKKGSNTNDGSKEAPFHDIYRALKYADADEIVINEGVYGWNSGVAGYSQTKPFNLIGIGKVVIGAHRENLTWNVNSTYSNVYQTNASSIVEIVDYKDVNDIKFLQLQKSIQDVSKNAGSYYIDSTNNIYVRTHDDRVPDDQILPNMTSDAIKVENNPNVYFENINFSNSTKITTTTANNKFFAKDCHFTIGSGGNALSVEGYNLSIVQNCIAAHATMDGFNYHIKNNNVTKAIEIDCKGFNNGRNGADQNNGSTSHDGGQIIRIRGEYFNNGGPNVIDVNEGSTSVNIGVHSHSSRATSGTVSNSNFKNGNVGTSKMYLYNCVSNNSDYSVVTATSQNSVTTIENSLLLEPQGEA